MKDIQSMKLQSKLTLFSLSDMHDFNRLNNQRFRKKTESFNLKEKLEEVCEIGKYKAALSLSKFKYNLNFAKENSKNKHFTKMV
tara:strand:+ start:1602 stop:1853 length:252 start_codon:yes stop_codon:yes gene_type:complete